MRPTRLNVIDIELGAIGRAASAEAAASVALAQNQIAQLNPFLRGEERT